MRSYIDWVALERPLRLAVELVHLIRIDKAVLCHRLIIVDLLI